MSREMETVFRNYLSPLSMVGGPQDAPPGAWPIALARWTEFLHRRAVHLLQDDTPPGPRTAGLPPPLRRRSRDRPRRLDSRPLPRAHLPSAHPPRRRSRAAPSPYISSDSLNLLVELRGGVRHEPADLLARLKIPSITPRILWLPPQSTRPPHAAAAPRPPASLIWSVDLVRHFIADIFVGLPIRRAIASASCRAPDVHPPPPNSPSAAERRAAPSSASTSTPPCRPPSSIGWSTTST